MKSTSKIHNILQLINYLGQTYSVLQSHLSEIDRVILFWCFCNLCSCWTRPFHICSEAMFWFVDLKWKQCFEHCLVSSSSSYINKQIWCSGGESVFLSLESRQVGLTKEAWVALIELDPWRASFTAFNWNLNQCFLRRSMGSEDF